MKKALIMELEHLLNENDYKKLRELKELIKIHGYADAERITEQVDLYINTRSRESRDALERIVQSLKNS